MQGRPWAQPVAEPIRCSECRAPLTDEEAIWYGNQCEHCTIELDKLLYEDVASEP